jgi:hypothetical protein
MTNQHRIIPPPELLQKWWAKAINKPDADALFATSVAQWSADQELEAFCEWLREAKNHGLGYEYGQELADRYRAARRPKPLSLKEQALAVLEEEPEDSKELIVFDTDQVNIIRRALEQLDD